MRTTLQLAATLLLLGAASTHAQITNPDNLIAPTPRNPARSTPQPTSDLQWLWQYTRPTPTGDQPALLRDPRFQTLLRDHLTAPQSMWGTPGSPLPEAARAFLAAPGTVASADNRHLILTGHTLAQSEQTGMLYIDLGEPNPLIVFAALRWNEQSNSPSQPGAPFTLWLFPSRPLEAAHLPESLRHSLASVFTRDDACKPKNITAVILVDPNGIPHITGKAEAGLMLGYCDPNPLFSTPRKNP
jgi:hypothetical protein